MSLLSERELCAIQELSERSMDDQCSVLRSTEARGDAGGVTQAWAQIATLNCRVRSGGVQGTGAREQLMAARLTPIAVFTVFVPVGSDVLARDRLVWSGRTFEVHGVMGGSHATALACVCTEVG